MKGVSAGAKRYGTRNMNTTSNLRGDNLFVKIVNSLPYAEDALRGKSGAVNNAMGKAARSMEKVIDSKLKKKMGAK